MKKIINIVALVAELLPGVVMVVAGLAVLGGGVTGVLWV